MRSKELSDHVWCGYVCMYIMYVYMRVDKKYILNGYFPASLPRETWTKDSPPTLDASLSLIRANGASCTRQFSTILLMRIIWTWKPHPHLLLKVKGRRSTDSTQVQTVQTEVW